MVGYESLIEPISSSKQRLGQGISGLTNLSKGAQKLDQERTSQIDFTNKGTSYIRGERTTYMERTEEEEVLPYRFRCAKASFSAPYFRARTSKEPASRRPRWLPFLGGPLHLIFSRSFGHQRHTLQASFPCQHKNIESYPIGGPSFPPLYRIL